MLEVQDCLQLRLFILGVLLSPLDGWQDTSPSVGGFGSLCTLAFLSFLWDPLTVSETIIPTLCISLPVFLSS